MKTVLRFFLYVRKSQGRKDRQVLSIPAQIEEMQAYAQKYGIEITVIFKEEKTAKEPGRPVFNEMLDRIEKGEADGVLVWKIDRLSRNPIDDGRISWMLQRGILKQIQTSERTYLPQDNVLFMRMEQGMANQYIIDLSKNVKRGMRKAAKSGWFPASVLPLGYIRNPNKKETRRVIIKDPERFHIVQELFNLYRSEVYGIPELVKIADQLNLKNQRGKRFNKNALYAMFRNPFYAGYYFWKNADGNRVRIEGKHPQMIPEVDFNLIQDIIEGKSWKMRPKRYDFPYKGLITCGECSGSITAEKKHRTTCTNCKRRFSSLHKKSCPECGLEICKMINPLVFDRTYYHCTKTKNSNCSQKAISEEQIEKRMIEIISELEITQGFYSWAIAKLENENPFEGNSPILLESLKKKKIDINKKMATLLDLRISGEITKEQNSQMHKQYSLELEQINKEIINRESRYTCWKRDTKTYLDFALNAVSKFKKASNREKREMISAFLSSQKILDKTLYFSTKKPLDAILYGQTGYTKSSSPSIQKLA